MELIHLGTGGGRFATITQKRRTGGIRILNEKANIPKILNEAMTGGMTKKRGMLVAAHSALAGNQHCESSISKYHQAMVTQVLDARPGTSFNIYGVNVSATETSHTDPAFVFHREWLKVYTFMGVNFSPQSFGSKGANWS